MFISICNRTFLDAFLIPGKGHISTACWHKSHRQLQKRCDNKYTLTHIYTHTYVGKLGTLPPSPVLTATWSPSIFVRASKPANCSRMLTRQFQQLKGLLCFPSPTHRILVGLFFFKGICSWETFPSHRIASFLCAPRLGCPSLQLGVSRFHFILCGDGMGSESKEVLMISHLYYLKHP